MRDGGRKGGGGSSHFGSGFGQTIAAYQETAKSTSGGDLCTTENSTARNKIMKDLTNQTHSQKCILYKVSVAASAKYSSIPPNVPLQYVYKYIFIYI